jgi:hypothetical protein
MGPQVGTIFYVRTSADRGKDHGFSVAWDVPGHPLWPAGIDPISMPRAPGLQAFRTAPRRAPSRWNAGNRGVPQLASGSARLEWANPA